MTRFDDIDQRIDEALTMPRNQRSGYDNNVNQDKCPHCARDWHGLAITQRMEEMRREYARQQSHGTVGEDSYATSAILDDYRYDQDDSQIICPGSMFIGPMPAKPWERYEVRVRSMSETLRDANLYQPQPQWWTLDNSHPHLDQDPELRIQLETRNINEHELSIIDDRTGGSIETLPLARDPQTGETVRTFRIDDQDDEISIFAVRPPLTFGHWRGENTRPIWPYAPLPDDLTITCQQWLTPQQPQWWTLRNPHQVDMNRLSLRPSVYRRREGILSVGADETGAAEEIPLYRDNDNEIPRGIVRVYNSQRNFDLFKIFAIHPPRNFGDWVAEDGTVWQSYTPAQSPRRYQEAFANAGAGDPYTMDAYCRRYLHGPLPRYDLGQWQDMGTLNTDADAARPTFTEWANIGYPFDTPENSGQ